MRSSRPLRRWTAAVLFLASLTVALLPPLRAMLALQPLPARSGGRGAGSGAVRAPVTARLDDQGRARRLYDLGRNAAKPPVAALQRDADTSARELVQREAGRLGFAGGLPQLQPISVRRSPSGTHVRLQQLHAGVPVWGAEVVASFDSRMRPTILASDLEVLPAGTGSPATEAILDASAAQARALQAVAPDSGWQSGIHCQLVYWRTDRRWRLAYRVTFACEQPLGDWQVWIDARDGSLLGIEDRTVFERRAYARRRPPARETLSRALSGAGRAAVFRPDPVLASGNRGLADLQDSDAAVPAAAYDSVNLFDLDPPVRGWYRLAGPYALLQDWESPAGAPDSSRTPDFVRTRSQQGFEDVMVYYHLDAMQRWYRTLGFQDANNRQQVADAHGMRGMDNSKFVPSLHKLSFGEGGVDDAEDAEVLVHEYSHATQYDIVPTWGLGGDEPAMGEGCGDYLANSYAYGLCPERVRRWNGVFQWDGHNEFWPGRAAVDPSLHYPEDAGLEVHRSGTLWCSALTEALYALGDRAVMDGLVLDHHYALTGTATMEDAANAILVSDLVLHGGAHVAALVTVFSRWGMLDASDWTPVAIEHEPLDPRAAAEGAPQVRARVATSLAALDSASVRALVRAAGTGWTPVALQVQSDGSFAARLPEPRGENATLEYYLEAQDVLGNTGRSPASAPGVPLRVPVGRVAERFEAETGWQPGTPGDDATQGRWLRAAPVGTAAQPDADHTRYGTRCMLTGNGAPGAPASDADVDGGRTTLLSPVYDLRGVTGAHLSYWRWYSNAAGTAPGEDTWIVQVSNDAGATWKTLESTAVSQAEWREMQFDLGAVLGEAPRLVRLRFEASDLGAPSLVEAAVDDICMQVTSVTDAGSPRLLPETRLACAPNPCNPATTLRFELPAASSVRLSIFDVRGRLLRTLLEAELPAGPRTVFWDGRDRAGLRVPSGVYTARLETAGGTTARKIAVLR